MNQADSKPNETNYRWYILVLASLTGTLAIAVPLMCLPVLFDEIAGELNLNLVEIGLVWGLGSLASIFTGVVWGAISDRLGARRSLYIACLLVGPVGALRGLAHNLAALAVTSFLYGFVIPMVMMNVTKICGLWFSKRQLGLANGVIAMGAALGFMVGSMISATMLSPWLGGWRNVLFFYGAITTILSIPWYFSRPEPRGREISFSESQILSLRQTIAHVSQIRNVWIMGFILFGISSCVDSMLGYLPLYLRGVGWPDAAADGALSTFHAASMLFVIPMAWCSDRLASRKRVLMIAGLMIVTGVGSLSLVEGKAVWAAVIIAGMVRDGFMAVLLTMLLETDGVGPEYMATAMGMVMVFSGIGRLIAAPLGNSLASITAALPFVFWAFLAIFGCVGIYILREEKMLSTA